MRSPRGLRSASHNLLSERELDGAPKLYRRVSTRWYPSQKCLRLHGGTLGQPQGNIWVPSGRGRGISRNCNHTKIERCRQRSKRCLRRLHTSSFKDTRTELPGELAGVLLPLVCAQASSQYSLLNTLQLCKRSIHSPSKHSE